jgi:hypothetical protein
VTAVRGQINALYERRDALHRHLARVHLAAAAEIIRAAYPTATAVLAQSSDNDAVLLAVYGGDLQLAPVAQDALDEGAPEFSDLADDADPDLGSVLVLTGNLDGPVRFDLDTDPFHHDPAGAASASCGHSPRDPTPPWAPIRMTVTTTRWTTFDDVAHQPAGRMPTAAATMDRQISDLEQVRDTATYHLRRLLWRRVSRAVARIYPDAHALDLDVDTAAAHPDLWIDRILNADGADLAAHNPDVGSLAADDLCHLGLLGHPAGVHPLDTTGQPPAVPVADS